MIEKKFEINSDKIKYLKLLSTQYPSTYTASTEIINLKAILNLPKGTEHFITDLHGEFDSFNHIMKNASGVIKSYISDIFGSTLRESEKRNLATLIYYPEERLVLAQSTEEDLVDWYRIMLYRLILVCRRASSKYTRSKVRKSIDSDFAYILEELLHENNEVVNKKGYYNEIIDTIISLDRASDFVIAICKIIHRLSIDHLHILGDIYDRGHHADKIMDYLQNYHSLDLQWGNHDISWMGAAAGSEACICTVLRISARYNDLAMIEESYGINLVPLVSFVMEHYKGECTKNWIPEVLPDDNMSTKEIELTALIHKAIAILQFKVEAINIKRHPEYKMDDRILLDKIDFENKTVTVEGKSYPLKDSSFPTCNPSDPLALIDSEKELLVKLKASFMNSEKLQTHARLLFNKGSMYKIFNSNLLFHGCVPMNDDGTLREINFKGEKCKGREYLDKVERIVRDGYFSPRHTPSRREGLDLMWYLWCGSDSPLFGKDKMTTFERYFIADKKTHKEKKDPYFEYRNSVKVCKMILEDFGLNSETSHIINGHVPVKASNGESPVKADGKLYVIDGGFSKPYQKVTGIAGYTLISGSWGLKLSAHEPFISLKDAIENEKDIVSQLSVIEPTQMRITVENTDIGLEIKNKINDLEELLYAYRKGLVSEIEI